MNAQTEHGTYAGHQRHKRKREDSCTDCRAAAAAYLKRWRARNPGNTARHTATVGARDKALRELAERHPEEFERLYAAELRRLATGDRL